MRKDNDIKKEVKKIKKSEEPKFNKRRSNNDIDLWKEIRTNFKPLVKAYNKFSDKRRITKQKEEERRLKEDEKQRLREEEALRLQKQEERRIKRQKKIEEEKERRLRAQEKLRLEEKRTKDEREGKIRQEQIYRERLVKGEEERIKQLKRVNEAREEEKKLRDKRNLINEGKFVEDQIPKKEEKSLKQEEQNLKQEEQRLKEERQRLKEERQRLIQEEQRLKEKDKRLKEEEKINLKEGRRPDAEQEELPDFSRVEKKRLNGTVKWFHEAKGYGFIKIEDQEKDIFVHLTDIQSSGLKYLEKGDKLTFEVEDSDKGLSAVNLQKTSNEDDRPHLKVVK